jgi:hypothetical protein
MALDFFYFGTMGLLFFSVRFSLSPVLNSGHPAAQDLVHPDSSPWIPFSSGRTEEFAKMTWARCLGLCNMAASRTASA